MTTCFIQTLPSKQAFDRIKTPSEIRFSNSTTTKQHPTQLQETIYIFHVELALPRKTIKMSKPIHITSNGQFKSLLSSNTYVLVDMTASWCGPCRQIAPVFEQLSTANSKDGHFAFVKVDVDEQPDIAQEYGISAMPTFLLMKNGEVEQNVRGANAPALKALVTKASADAAKIAADAGKKKEATTAPAEDQETVSGSYTVSSNPSWKMAL
jgi:thioredoxin 1